MAGNQIQSFMFLVSWVSKDQLRCKKTWANHLFKSFKLKECFRVNKQRSRLKTITDAQQRGETRQSVTIRLRNSHLSHKLAWWDSTFDDCHTKTSFFEPQLRLTLIFTDEARNHPPLAPLRLQMTEASPLLRSVPKWRLIRCSLTPCRHLTAGGRNAGKIN